MLQARNCSALRPSLVLAAILLFNPLLCCDSSTPVSAVHVVLPGTGDLSLAAREPQGFVDLPFAQLPNMSADPEIVRRYFPPLDEDSVEMFSYNGGTYYHPVNLCHRMFGFIAAYFSTKDTAFIDRAQKTAARLLEQSIRSDSCIYAPYRFAYKVHGNPAYALDTPWFSGMAQGEFLEALTRLYELTQDSAWLFAADSVFASLLRLRTPDSPWVVALDSANYYWIEEYPLRDGMDMTLNGYMAAVFGVYDYYRVTRDPAALTVYEMSLTTLKAYLPVFRRPGQLSYYCLGHKVIANQGYHDFHCSQLRNLYNITGDAYFSDMAALFDQDQ